MLTSDPPINEIISTNETQLSIETIQSGIKSGIEIRR